MNSSREWAGQDGGAGGVLLSGRTRLLLRVMTLHLVLFGALLLFGALALAGYLYTLEFEQIELSSGLRISRSGDIYASTAQAQTALVVGLAVASLLQFWTVRQLSLQQRAALPLVRLCALLLMVGIPAGGVLWALSGPGQSGDVGLMRQTLHDLAIGVRALAAMLIAQAGLALIYLLATFGPGLRRWCAHRNVDTNTFLRRTRRMALLLWVLLLVGLGLALGVLTDWLYELPVPQPGPGELLYVTSFDALNEEWDLFPGRDTAEVGAVEAGPGEVAALAGGVLQVSYGSGRSDEIVWTTLDRKFGDFDLRVTAQLQEGPIDQNQFGVIFRYRDSDNFYMLLITADGYYSLQKVHSGLREKISDWGLVGAIQQGASPNELRIVARGDRFTFYVNGVALPLCLKGENNSSMWATWEGPGICYTDELRYVYQDSTFSQGRIALVAGSIDGSDVRVAFDDLVIVGPGPESAVAPMNE